MPWRDREWNVRGNVVLFKKNNPEVLKTLV